MSAKASHGTTYLREYYRLAKPGIVYGNVFTTIAAFLFASRLHIDILLFLSTIIGLGLVIASAAVFNNCLDRDMDAKMERTSTRALVTGIISLRSAVLYACILGVAGFSILYTQVNTITTLLAVFGFVSYVGLYSSAKRVSAWAAVLGTLPGAVPIVVGYTAVIGHLDAIACILLLVLVFWQLPHFYGIALYRLNEYRAAGVPVLPAEKGVHTTKIHTVVCIVLYILATATLTFYGYTGYIYLILTVPIGLAWLVQALRGYQTTDPAQWGRKVFLFSLIVLVSFSCTLALSSVLP